MSENRHIAIVCNPGSGKGKPLKLLPSFESFLKQHNLAYTVFTAQLPDSLQGFTDLVIMGGDGTINYTVNHFKQINIPVGIVRCGTGNDFSDLLFGKHPVQNPFHTALFALPKQVDAGMCNGRLFLNGVGIGFDGWVVKKSLGKKLFSGIAAYYSTVISLLFFYRETPVRITVDGTPFQTNLFMLSAANGKTYGGGFKVAPDASIHDGLLEVIAVKEISLLRRFRYLPVIEKGKHLNLPFIQYKKAKQITVESDTPLQAHLDGEHLISSTFEISILPGYYQIRY
jgi:diacylglycerol kinase (ATP)